MTLREEYVRGVRAIRRAANAVRLLGALDRLARRSRWACWARSLLAVYDLQDLVALDVPWWTFRSADAIDGFLSFRPHARVFEWGSGASTVWLAKRAAFVVSIDHDATWAAAVRRLAPVNAEVKHVPAPCVEIGKTVIMSGKSGFAGLDFTDYVLAIDREGGFFDLIVIDGRAREMCLLAALRHLAPKGTIVFDNVDRARYRDAIADVGPSLEVRSFGGLTPCLPYPTCTALLRLSES